MKPSILFPIGLACVLLGGLWILQGFGVVGGSGMSDVRSWGFVGIVVALAGLALVGFGIKRR